MFIIGLDPGVKGALTVINMYNWRATQILRFENNTPTDIWNFLSELRGGEVYGRAKRITGDRPLPLIDEHFDNQMEIYIEEPGPIVVNRKNTNVERLLAGANASRKLAKNVGMWEGICVALNITPNMLNPKTWQAKMLPKTPIKGDKKISQNMAKKLFPFLTDAKDRSIITQEIADSVLLAVYGYVQYVPRARWPNTFKTNILHKEITRDNTPAARNRKPLTKEALERIRFS